MDTTKVGVVGVGHLGKIHASLYREVKDCQLVGVYDIDEEKMNHVASNAGVKAYPSFDALLEDVDAVNIVTTTTTHYELAKKAIQNGKHIFIEKPLTISESEAQELVDLADQYGRIIQIGHIERFNPAILALQDVTLKPLFIEAHRLASFNPRGTDVAVIFDLMIHELDLILYLIKSEPTSVVASGVNVVSNSVDIANARIGFANGCVANITASRISSKKMRKMRLFQKNAYISMDFVQGFSEIFYIPEKDQSPFHDGTLAFSLGQIEQGAQVREIKYNRLERQNVNPLKYELSSFIESIRNDLEPLVSARDGLAALQLANRVLREIEKHQMAVTEHAD